MKLIILDRDGVINHDSDQYIKSPAEWKPIEGSIEAIAHLTQAGFSVVIATNQSGVERGLFDMDTLNAIHDKMFSAVKNAGGRIEAIFYCPHQAEAGCDCRKPKPGMLRMIAAHFNTELDETFAIGDSLRDLEAAKAAGALPILVKTGKGLKTMKEKLPKNTLVFEDLNAAVNHILEKS